jgi:hypothetical protein
MNKPVIMKAVINLAGACFLSASASSAQITEDSVHIVVVEQRATMADYNHLQNEYTLQGQALEKLQLLIRSGTYAIDRCVGPPETLEGSLLQIILSLRTRCRDGAPHEPCDSLQAFLSCDDNIQSVVPLVAVIPAGSEIIAVQYEASDSLGSGGCYQGGGECNIGFSMFLPNLSIASAKNALLVGSAFVNWSQDRDRVAKMTVVYRYRPPLSAYVKSKPVKANVRSTFTDPRGNGCL